MSLWKLKLIYILLEILSKRMMKTSLIINSLSACRCYTFIEKRHATSGIFKSPNYSDYFSSNIPCIFYIFRGKENQTAKISFQSFRMSPQIDGNCADYLELYLNLKYIENFTQSKYDYKLCGNLEDQTEFYSRNNILIMKFYSTPSPKLAMFNGFFGTFQFENKELYRTSGHKIIGSKCSQQFFSSNSDETSGKSGLFFSPNYPQNYDSNMRCQYIFKAQPEERIILSFRSIFLGKQNMECGSEIQNDYILVTERLFESKQSVLAHLCGIYKYVQIVSHGPLVTVTFVSNNDDVEGKGFEAVYEFIARFKVYPTSFINTTIDLDTITKVDTESETKIEENDFYSKSSKYGTITSPNYPQSYSNDCEVLYIFHGNSNEYVEIKFKKLKLRSSDNCQKKRGDRIEIYDGEFSRMKILTKSPNAIVCGNPIYFRTSRSNFLTLRFISDSSPIKRDSGFIFEYYFIKLMQTTQSHNFDNNFNEKKECIHVIHSNGTLTKGKIAHNLEKYSNSYKDESCKWILHGTKNQRIVIKIRSSGLQSDSNNGNEFFPSCRLGKDQIVEVLSYRSDSPAGDEHSEIIRRCIGDGVYSLMSSNVPRMDIIMHFGSLKANLDRYNEAIHMEYYFVRDFGVKSNGIQKNSSCHFYFDSSRFSSGNFTSPNYPGNIPSNIACVYVFKGSVKSQIQIFLTEHYSYKYQSFECSENNGNSLNFESCSDMPLERSQIICIQSQIRKLSPLKWSDNCLRISLISKSPKTYMGFLGHYRFFESDQLKSTAAGNTLNTANSLIILMTITFSMVMF